MDEMAQRALVSSESVRRVKTAKAAAAESAAAFVIQGERILKWRPATDTEKLGVQRFRRLNAAAAYGEPGDLAQSVAADAARFGKEEGKKGVKG
jgi:hypothetical protein